MWAKIPSLIPSAYEAIKRVVEAECKASGMERTATITRKVRAPLTSNAPKIVRPLKKAFEAYFGENAGDGEPRTPCEDFSILATTHDKPYAYWFIGAIDRATWDKAEREGSIAKTIPSNHSP